MLIYIYIFVNCVSTLYQIKFNKRLLRPKLLLYCKVFFLTNKQKTKKITKNFFKQNISETFNIELIF